MRKITSLQHAQECIKMQMQVIFATVKLYINYDENSLKLAKCGKILPVFGIVHLKS